MDFFTKGLNGDANDCLSDEMAIQNCPFLRNINKPTSFSFSSSSMSFPPRVRGAKGPIFEEGPNFDASFRLFHGKGGVVPLTERLSFPKSKVESVPQFNPLAAKAATISFSSFGPGGPFSFGPFSDTWKKQKKEPSSEKGQSGNHEAQGNEWFQTGNCPITKSYRAVNTVLPLVAKALQPPPGMNLKCPQAVIAARAALARTAFVKTLRPEPLPSKMLVIALLGMAVNVPLGVWREHTKKFSVSWFAAVHAAVPFIAMLRKSVVMPKSAMALTIGASILGQTIGSRAERFRLKALSEKAAAAAQTTALSENVPLPQHGSVHGNVVGTGSHCSAEVVMKSGPAMIEAGGGPPTSNLCF